MEKRQFLELIDKYLNGYATSEEEKWLFDYFNRFQEDQDWNEKELGIKEQLETKLLERLHKAMARPAQKKSVSLVRTWQYAAAAILLIVLSAGLHFWRQSEKGNAMPHNSKNDIVPGGNNATLTLADGQKISLTDLANGKVAEQAGITVTKAADGQLIYNSGGNTAPPNSAAFNTLTTPRAGQFQIVLADGTRVWLNAESSLRYPAVFEKNERKVELEGEAYFEVAENKKSPFRVISNQTTVNVLGTHFNVMAYKDEKKQVVTLLEGSVKISRQGEAGFLRPGEQATLTNDNQSILISGNADLEEAVAWKNGYFMFLNEPIESIMRKISRWYDVDIIYKDDVHDKALWGTVSRFKNVSEVLKRLELTGVVRFKIEALDNTGNERRIIVMK